MTRSAMESIETQAKQYRNRAHEGAFIRGARARYHNKPRESCPYRDGRHSFRNLPTWSKAFRNAWLDGYDAQMRVENEAAMAALRGVSGA